MFKAEDLTGRKFGKLTVIERVPNNGGKDGHARWRCRCDCGNYTEALSHNLKSGDKVSCGCASHPGSHGISPVNYRDLTGRRFGRLTVIRRESEIGQKVRWLCRCDCGNEKVIAAYALTSGNTKSCGCLQSESRHINAKKHGGRGTRLYNVWKAMRQRCNDPNYSSYPYYGGRGISVCEEWSDYQVFRDWAFANGYDPDAPRGQCTIDRIDVNGDYEPSNCRWVNTAIQNKNRRPFKHRGGKFKPVIRIDSSGNEVRYESIKEASEAVGAPTRNSNIGACCNHQRKSAYGYMWRFA